MIEETKTTDGLEPEGGEHITKEEVVTPNPDESKEEDTQKSLINEVKALREERRLAREQAEKLKLELDAKNESEKDEVDKKLEAFYKEKQVELAKSNKDKAFSLFVSEHKEFHEGNDPAGIKMQALKDKFNIFNTTGLTETEQFISVLKDAYRLIGGKDSATSDSAPNPYASTASSSAGTPKGNDDDKELSRAERKLMETGGYSKERLIKIRESQPDVYEQLMSFVRV